MAEKMLIWRKILSNQSINRSTGHGDVSIWMKNVRVGRKITNKQTKKPSFVQCLSLEFESIKYMYNRLWFSGRIIKVNVDLNYFSFFVLHDYLKPSNIENDWSLKVHVDEPNMFWWHGLYIKCDSLFTRSVPNIMSFHLLCTNIV